MNLLGKGFNQITAVEITALVENEKRESINLEYKREFWGKDEKQRYKLLKAVSAFANTNGGIIIVGIEEVRDAEGNPNGELCIRGLNGAALDKEILRVEQVLRLNLDPLLGNVQFREIAVDDKTVLLIGVPRSLFAPHMITLGGGSRFYVRTNTGTAPMDVHELRQAFLQTDEWEKQADNFRKQRIMDVLHTGIIPSLVADRGLFIHILPLGTRPLFFELFEFANDLQRLDFFPSLAFNKSYNIEGPLLTAVPYPPKAFIQGFRNQGIEVFTSGPLRLRTRDQESTLTIDGDDVEAIVLTVVRKYLTLSAKQGIPPPIAVFLALTNVAGGYLTHHNDETELHDSRNKRIDRNDIILPGVAIESTDADLLEVLGPTFDMLWQAAGWQKSPLAKYWEKNRPY